MRTNGRIDARHVLKVAGVGRTQDGRHANRVLVARLRDLHVLRCGMSTEMSFQLCMTTALMHKYQTPPM